MKNEFIYKEKFPLWIAITVLALIAVTVYCFMTGASIGFRRLVILPYPASVIVGVILSALTAFYAVFKLRKVIGNTKNGTQITLEDSSITFPKGKETILLNYSDITNVNLDEDEDGKSVDINTDGKCFTLEESGFSSSEDFMVFVNMLKERIAS